MATLASIDGIQAVHAAIRLAQSNARRRPWVAAGQWDAINLPSHGVREQLTPAEEALLANL